MSNARFTIIQARAVADPRISYAQFRTLAALGCYGDRDGWCFPKLKTLGDMLSKSPQAVSRDIQALVELGYVEVRPQYRDDGGRTSNLYRLIHDAPTPGNVEGASTSEVDTPSPSDVDTPSPSDVEGPSPSGVEALTSHNNDPVNDPNNEEHARAIRPSTPDTDDDEEEPLPDIVKNRGAYRALQRHEEKRAEARARNDPDIDLGRFDERQRPYARAFVEATEGRLVPIKSDYPRWRQVFNEWLERRFTPDDIRRTIKHMRDDSLHIKGPGSVTGTVLALQLQEYGRGDLFASPFTSSETPRTPVTDEEFTRELEALRGAPSDDRA